MSQTRTQGHTLGQGIPWSMEDATRSQILSHKIPHSATWHQNIIQLVLILAHLFLKISYTTFPASSTLREWCIIHIKVIQSTPNCCHVCCRCKLVLKIRQISSIKWQLGQCSRIFHMACIGGVRVSTSSPKTAMRGVINASIYVKCLKQCSLPWEMYPKIRTQPAHQGRLLYVTSLPRSSENKC